MTEFTVYYRYSYCGWLKVEAETKEQAKQLAEEKWEDMPSPSKNEDIDFDSFKIHTVEDENGYYWEEQ